MNIVILALSLCARPAVAGVQWSKTFAEAVEKSKSSGKPILVDFQAPWCYSCYYMDRRVLSGGRFVQASSAVVPLKLDVDEPEGHALKAVHAVTFLPSYVLLAAGGGKELGRIVGEQTEEDFLARLSMLLAGRGAGEDASARKLRARLAKGDVAALEKLLQQPADCQTPYDIMKGAAAVDALSPQRRGAILRRERLALESLARTRLFVGRESRCADFRSGIETLGEVHGKLGDAAQAEALYARAADLLESDGLKVGDDRSHDDNRRYFLELKGNEPALRAFYEKLIKAYPSDYVYAYRFARHLLGREKYAEALPWIERADKLSYGANRLTVTNTGAKILAALGRKEEAVALLARDIKAGKAHFPKEAKRLEETLETLSKE